MRIDRPRKVEATLDRRINQRDEMNPRHQLAILSASRLNAPQGAGDSAWHIRGT
jgi:hypothetical protein